VPTEKLRINYFWHELRYSLDIMFSPSHGTSTPSNPAVEVDNGMMVLAVALQPLEPSMGFSISYASTGREAFELLKVLRFDLLVVSPDLPDMSVWTLVETVKQFWPWQRWALVAPQASDEMVKLAGEQGAIGVFSKFPSLVQKRGSAVRGRMRFGWPEPDPAESLVVWEASATMQRAIGKRHAS